MAQKLKIEVYGTDVVLSNIRNNIQAPIFGANDNITASLVTQYYDGTDMDDSKVDGKIYFKLQRLPSDLIADYGQYIGDYFRLNLINDGQNFLEKDTVSQLRLLNSTEILLLRMGYYKGVKLNGYYSKDDTPAPLLYFISSNTDADNGGSIFEIGSLKIEHQFVGDLNLKYFGLQFSSNVGEVLARVLSAKPKQPYIDWIVFPKGTYQSAIPISINLNNIRIRGEETILEYSYQQINRTSGNGVEQVNSLLVFPRDEYINGFILSDIELKYTGDYWIPNTATKYSHSYGSISGILAPKVSNFVLNKVTIRDFNDCGVRFDTFDMPVSFGDSYNVSINECSFIHNNFSGVFCRNVDRANISYNSFSLNGTGMDPDMVGVTGYGLAFANYNGNFSKNLSLNNNQFIGNNRKGLDSHGCGDIKVINNIFDGNRAFQLGLIYNSGVIFVDGNLFKNHLPLPTFVGKSTLAFCSIDLGKPNSIAELNFANYKIHITNNIFRDIDTDVVNGEKLSLIRCLTDVKGLNLNISDNTIDAKSLHNVFYLTNQIDILNKSNSITISNNRVKVSDRLTGTLTSIGGCEYINISTNNFESYNQGISVDGTTVSSRDNVFITDINIANAVRNITVTDNIFNGTKRNGSSTTEFIAFPSFMDISSANRISKLISSSNWVNNNKSNLDTNKEYADNSSGEVTNNNVTVINNPPSGRLLLTAALNTGAILVRLPKQILNSGITDDKLLKVEIDVINYDTSASVGNKASKILISGRIFKDTSVAAVWRSCQATVIDEGNTPQIWNLRVGFDSNTYPVIIIQDVGEIWRASVFAIKSVTLGLGTNQIDDYKSNYNISLVTSLSGITIDRIIPNINPRINATTTNRGLVLMSASSGNTAVAPGATYAQSEAQGVLTELRDLKTKLQAAGILSV